MSKSEVKLKQKKWICMISVNKHIGDNWRRLYCSCQNFDPQLPDWSRLFGGYFGLNLLGEVRPPVKLDVLEDWLKSRKFVCVSTGEITENKEHSLLMTAALDEYFEISFDKDLTHPKIRYLAESI